MSLYLSIQLYEPEKPAIEDPEDLELMDTEDPEGEGLVEQESKETEEKEKILLRSIKVSLVKGLVRIESVSSDPVMGFNCSLNEQLTNEFLIQAEMLDIRKWSPMRYSPAYAGGVRCSWVLEYRGLKGESIMHTGDDTYPRSWPVLMDLIDAFNEMQVIRQESVRIAADSADQKRGADFAGMIDMVNILSAMHMPQDVIAAGIFRQMMRKGDLDTDYVHKYFDRTVSDLLGEYGSEEGLDLEDRRIALIERVKESDSMYFKRLVLAEVLSDLIAVKAKMDRGEGFSDPVMSRTDMGLYYAEMISSLDDLENDQRAGIAYSRLVDMYKSIFVSYSLDSIRGVIYQTQGDTAGVMLERGGYDWHPIKDAVPDDVSPVSKKLALFLAGLWRREADERLVKDGNKEGTQDVPDTTVLKVVMGKTGGKRARKDNKVAVSILKRMISEDEQLLTAIRAEALDMDLIENDEVEDVNQIPVSFLGLEDEDGGVMAAVFTSMDELGEVDDGDIEAIPVKMIFQFVKNMRRLDGIIINPFSDRFVVSKEKIGEVLDDLEQSEKELI